MYATFNPKSARKNLRRQVEQQGAAQFAKICQHLDGYVKIDETPAMAVKRLLEELKALGVHKPPVIEGYRAEFNQKEKSSHVDD